jgi:hypothetical protein
VCKSCRIDFDALDEIPDSLHYRLALALARYTDRTGEAWPAIRTLAKMVKKPPTTIHRALVAMERLAYVERHNRPGKSTRYRIAERFFRRPLACFTQDGTPCSTQGETDRSLSLQERDESGAAGADAPSQAAPTSLDAPDGGSGRRPTPPARERRCRRRTNTSSSAKTLLPEGWSPTPEDYAYIAKRIENHAWVDNEWLDTEFELFCERQRILQKSSANWSGEIRWWFVKAIHEGYRHGHKPAWKRRRRAAA